MASSGSTPPFPKAKALRMSKRKAGMNQESKETSEEYSDIVNKASVVIKKDTVKVKHKYLSHSEKVAENLDLDKGKSKKLKTKNTDDTVKKSKSKRKPEVSGEVRASKPKKAIDTSSATKKASDILKEQEDKNHCEAVGKAEQSLLPCDEKVNKIIKKNETQTMKVVCDYKKTPDKPKPVDLLDNDRKPIKFSVKSKSNFDAAQKTPENNKAKPAMHPSILAFQRLAKTVKWSKPSTTVSKKQPPKRDDKTLGNVPVIELDNEEKEKSKGVTSKTVLQDRGKAMNLLTGFKIPKKKVDSKFSKLQKGLVNYVLSDDDDSEEQEEKKFAEKPLFRFQKFIKSPQFPESDGLDSKFKKRARNQQEKQKQKVPLFDTVDVSDEDEHKESALDVSKKYHYKRRTLDVPSEDRCKKTALALPDKDHCKESTFEVDQLENKSEQQHQEEKAVEDKSDQKELLSKYCFEIHQKKRKKKVADIKKNAEVKKNAEIEGGSHNVESMEVEMQDIIKEISSFRGSLNLSHHKNKKQLCDHFDANLDSFYCVVDTNVLLHDLGFLEKLKATKMDGKPVVIVVPYVVIIELDGLKKSLHVGKASFEAICWCNSYFEKKDCWVVGQNYDEYLSTLNRESKSSPDDLIRDCCRLLKKQNLYVKLITNDVNLRNKAILSAIDAASVQTLKSQLRMKSEREQMPMDEEEDFHYHEEKDFGNEPPHFCSVIVEKKESCDIKPLIKEKKACREKGVYEDSTPQTEKVNMNLLEDIRLSLHKTLGRVLELAFIESYGEDLWEKIIIRKPPWTLLDLFVCCDKHWIAVLNDKFPSSVKELLRDMRHLTNRNQNKSETEKLLRKVHTFYGILEKTHYKVYIHPIYPKNTKKDVQDFVMEDTEPGTEEQKGDINTEVDKPNGVKNVLEMINRVGLYITHFMAMIFDGCHHPHEFRRINDTQMTREDAQSSAINLHSVIMKLGITVVTCLTSSTPESLQELGTLLVNFWDDAKEPCPALPFTLEDLHQAVTTLESRKYLETVTAELERLLFLLNNLMAS